MLLLMGPGTLGMAATQVNLLGQHLPGHGQGTGAVSMLDYAFRVMYLPIGSLRCVGGDGDHARGGATCRAW